MFEFTNVLSCTPTTVSLCIVLCVNSVASVLLSVHPSSSVQEDEDSQSSFIMKNAKQGQAALGPGFTLKF